MKLALAIGYRPPQRRARIRRSLATVFTASGADGDNCHEICQMLATADRQISPTRFHNSVHNAPAGYWSIATGAKSRPLRCAHSMAASAPDCSRPCCQVRVARAPVLLIAYDTGYPEPLNRVRPIADAFGIGTAAVARTRAPAHGSRRSGTHRRRRRPSLADPPARSLAHGLSGGPWVATAHGTPPAGRRAGKSSTISITPVSP